MTDTANYAWIIDTDHLAEPGAAPGSFADNAATVSGPRDAPKELLARLADGDGRKFRMYDDDDELYYEGRIIVADRDGTAWRDIDGGEEDFGPLRDFGVGNAGCTAIKYKQDGKWVAL